MAIVKVYDKEGKEYEKETVDARECCKIMGWTMTKPEVIPAIVDERPDDSEPGTVIDAQGTEPIKQKRAYNKKG